MTSFGNISENNQQFYKNDDIPILVKSFESYGINIINSYTDINLIGRKINSSPLVQYYNSFTKAIIDYSNTISENDLDYISILLQGITNGNTFTITNGYYIKEQDGITSNINGVYQFDGVQNNNLILTTVISSSSLNTAENRYERDYFVDPPQFTLNSGFTGDPYYVIKSATNFGKIEELGAIENDLIEISYSGNTANIDKFQIEKIETSSENEEIIFLKDFVYNDNRLGQLTTLNLYVRGTPSLSLVEKDTTINGCSKTYTTDGYYLDCYDNQNEYQSYLRRFNYDNKSVLSTWTEDCNCTGFTAGQITDGLIFDYEFTFKVDQSAYLVFLPSDLFALSGQYNPQLSLSAGIYKIDQSHISNYSTENSYQIVFAETYTDFLEGNYLNISTTNSIAGKQNSYTLLTITSSTPRQFYYGAAGVKTIFGLITVS
jgi:hypothetical protein